MFFMMSLSVFSCCFSQAIPPSPDAIADTKNSIQSKTIQSSASSGFLSYQNFVKLIATNDGTNAEANISYLIKSSINISADISTPVTSQTQLVKPLTASGLSDNTSLTLSAQKILWGAGFKYDTGMYTKARAAVGKATGDFNYDDLTAEQKEKFDRTALIDWGTAFYFGAKLGFERQDFNYLIDSSVSFESEEESKVADNFSLSVGVLSSTGWVFCATYTYKSGYGIDDPADYSIPLGNGGFIEKQLSPTPPYRQKGSRIKLECISKVNASSAFRLNPNITVVFNQKLFSIELPVYFLSSDEKKMNFNGGGFVGYVSDKNYKAGFKAANLDIGAFIGTNIRNPFK
jgi:hypothetical protein